MTEWICDFCSDPEPLWLYRAHTIEYQETNAMSESGWSACQTCADLINQNKAGELAKRTTDIMQRRHPEIPRDDMFREVVHLQGRFFDSRIEGPPLRVNQKKEREL